jgi:single-strand DNA-binding protein
MGVNRAVIVGTLGEDPQIQRNTDGNTIASISVITSDYWKDHETGETMQGTESHRVVLLGGMAEFASLYLRKGLRAYFEGSMRTHIAPNAFGVDSCVTEIVADQLELAG